MAITSNTWKKIVTTLTALTALIGVIAAVAQIIDYVTTGKVSVLLITLVILFSAVPIIVISTLWVRQGSGSTFSWDTFRTVGAVSATLGIMAVGTITVVVITSTSNPSTLLPPPSTLLPPPATLLPPPTTCPPAGQAGARAARIISLVGSDFSVADELAYYKVALVGKVQLEFGGQLVGSTPPGKQLFILSWNDPTTNDSTPEHHPGNGLYYRWTGLQLSKNCYIQPQVPGGYSGVNGITFRQFFVLVDVRQIADFTDPKYNDGYDDAALDSLGVTRLAYFDIPTSNL